MCTPTQLYPYIQQWFNALPLGQRLAREALAALVTAVLVSQSLRAADLSRALPSPLVVPAAQRFCRVRRAWTRPWLSPAVLTAPLVQATVALWAASAPARYCSQPAVLALDSVRCGPWEVITLGLVWTGRVALVGAAVLPYPWPKKRFTPTVCALIRQVAAAWPAGLPVHLVADRGFPSKPLFQTLRAVGWDWTIRLRARSWVTVAGQPQWARDLLTGAVPGRWTARPGSYGSGATAMPGTLVVGRGLVVLPRHQRTAGSLRHRQAQQVRRQRHLASKHPGRADASAETDAWVLLFTSTPAAAAQRAYRRRWAIEGTYRDGQGGWDGRHGWDLEAVLARQKTAEVVERIVGLWALANLVQLWVGDRLGAPDAPVAVQQVLRTWTTTGRLSQWGRGHLAFRDPHGTLVSWLEQTLAAGAAVLAQDGPVAAVPPPPVVVDVVAA